MTYIVAISAYLVLLTIFGLIVARKKVKTSDDMVTGGHRIPFIILVGTLLATWCGGGGITGSASVVYTGGPWVGLITFAAPPIGIILLYFIGGMFIHDPFILAVIVIETAMPAASTGIMMCLTYGGDTRTMSRGTFLTTVFSLVSLPLLALLVV